MTSIKSTVNALSDGIAVLSAAGTTLSSSLDKAFGEAQAAQQDGADNTLSSSYKVTCSAIKPTVITPDTTLEYHPAATAVRNFVFRHATPIKQLITNCSL